MNFIIAVSKNKKALQLCNTPCKKFYKIKCCFIRPMYIFKYNDGIFFLIL